MSLILEDVGLDVGAETFLDGIALSFAPGSLNVLLGATLSGKTSLMRLMAGLDTPTRGRIRVDGRDVTGWPVRRRDVAMVYQQFINYPALTVRENIASPLRVRGAPKSEIETKVREAARLLKLEPYLDRLPLALSGGQQQRTALARALVKGAGLVLLDEPLANLDYKLREELREELPRLFSASGAILVYATTEPAEALMLGGTTATLSQGRVTEVGPAAALYRAPADLVTAQVFSDPPLNTVTASVRGGRMELGTGAATAPGGPLAALPDGDYTLGFRAHHLALEPIPGAAIAFPGTVSVSEITGSESYVHLDSGPERFVALVPGILRRAPGSAVTAWLDPARILVFGADGRRAGAVALRAA